LDLFKYNDNSKNTFSDNYYRAAMVEALGETVTPVVSVLQGQDVPIRAEDLSPDTKLILDEVTRFLNMEKLLPSYKFVVTNACLKAIRKLQKTGHLVSKPVIFRDYAAYGQFVDIRLTALECLVDYVRVEGSESDLGHLLALIERDPVPFVRHKLLRMLVDNPPFDKNRDHRNDTHALVERLWKLMNSNFWYDSRLRCDVVDLYFKLYGRKRPHAVPIAELAMLNKATKVKTENTEAKKFTIPKAEKRKIVSEEPEGKPVDFSGAIEARAVMPAEVPDYFSTSAVPSPLPIPSTSERAPDIQPPPSKKPHLEPKLEPKLEPVPATSSHKPHKEKKKEKKEKKHKDKKKHKKNKKHKKHKSMDKMLPDIDLGLNEASQGLSSGSSTPSPPTSPKA